MSCNKCNRTYCNCCKPSCSKKSCSPNDLRYQGSDIDCLGISQGDSLDFVVSQISQFVCDNFLQDGTDGVGIDNIVDNGDGTFTINLTNGETFTTPDFTGQPGEPGEPGEGCDCCNFQAEIVFDGFQGQIDTIPQFSYITTGGEAPYIVQWSIVDTYPMFSFVGGIDNDETVTLQDVEGPTADGCGGGTYRTNLLKLTLTDANGCKTTDFYQASYLICPN